MKRILLVLADGFEEIEALGTADVLRRCGLEVVLAGLNQVEVTGAHGIKVLSDARLDDVAPATFDAVTLPGGMPGATHLYADERVGNLIRDFYAVGKIVSAICAAPIVLDKAGVLNHRRFTMYPAAGLFDYLTDGRRPQPDLTVTDGNVVTGKGPGATPFFAAAVAAALGVPKAQIDAELAGMFFSR